MTTVVNVAQVAANMAVLGWGRRRAGVWTQGCDVGCPGCSSAHTHDTARGRIVAVNDMLEWFSAQASTFDGLTISGGEPTMQSDAVLELIEATHQLTVRGSRGGVRCRDCRPVRALPSGAAAAGLEQPERARADPAGWTALWRPGPVAGSRHTACFR